MAEAQRLVDVLLVELERQRRRAADDLERRDLELDLAGRHVQVDRLGAAGDELPLPAPEDELVPDLVGELGRFRRELRVDHELRDSAPVAQVDEDQAAVVAAARDPAGRDQRLTDELLRGLGHVVRQVIA